MSEDGTSRIDYKAFTEDAFRGIMVRALEHVAEHGLPGEHSFSISFLTTHPGVDMPDWLREQYPEGMMIRLEGWFDELAVMDDRFSVILNFGDDTMDAPERIVVPFRAVTEFVDPSVRFGLRFQAEEDEDEDGEDEDGEAAFPDDGQDMPEQGGTGEAASAPGQVVSLDSFRKK